MIDEKQQLIDYLLKLDFYCQRHPNEIANFICVNLSNTIHGLMCPLCMQQSKQAQQQIHSIKYLIKQIKTDSSILTNNISQCSFADFHREQIMKQMHKVYGKKVNSNLQESFIMFFNKVSNMFNGNYFLPFFQAIHILKDKKQEGRRLIQKFVINYSQLLEQVKGQSNQNEISNSQAIISSFRTKIKQLWSLIKQKTPQQNILEFLTENKRTISYKFTPKMMGSSMNISADGLSVEMTSQDGASNQLALIQPKITSNKKSTIKFKIGRISGWISVGVCWKSKVQSMSYRFQAGTDHGCYHISYDGYSWSDSKSEDNEKYIGWYYNEGDIIEVQVDSQQNYITFNKNGAQAHTLIYTKEKKDKLHFGVALNYLDDKVQIIS